MMYSSDPANSNHGIVSTPGRLVAQDITYLVFRLQAKLPLPESILLRIIKNMTQKGNSGWFNQALRQAPWRTQTQATSLVMTMVIIVVVIGTMYLAQASRTAAAGRKLQVLEAERQVLEQKNAQLRAEVAALRSVPRLITEAEKIGFHMAESNDIEYLQLGDAPPALTPTPTPFPSADEIVPAYDETLGSWLTEQMSALQEQMGEFFQHTFGAEETPVP
jgi:cell division protein FtsL